jgi:hypothetical protein
MRAAVLRVGDLVEVDKHGVLFPARVTAVDPPGQVNRRVHFEPDVKNNSYRTCALYEVKRHLLSRGERRQARRGQLQLDVQEELVRERGSAGRGRKAVHRA